MGGPGRRGSEAVGAQSTEARETVGGGERKLDGVLEAGEGWEGVKIGRWGWDQREAGEGE